jgi:pyruvate,water dikinase
LRKGHAAILRRSLGSKLQRMVFGGKASAGRSTKTVDTPDEDRNRFSLDDAQILDLARSACAIENHYGRPMDIEWALDGADGRLYILQARPETVRSQQRADAGERFRLQKPGACWRPGARSATRSAPARCAW